MRGWVTIDTATGQPTKVGDLPGGSVIFADGRFYCLTETGTMLLQELTETGFRTAGTFRLAEGKDAWAHPCSAKAGCYSGIKTRCIVTTCDNSRR